MAYTTHGGPTRHPTTLDTNHPGSTGITNHAAATNHPASGSSGPTQLWTLVSSVTCLRAWQTDFGLTMGGTPLASGTTPPVVTLTGAASGNVALRLEIQTTGTDGVATYRYGAANDGTTSTFIESGLVVPAGGGTYAAIGALTGVTVNFPAGTYTNDNVYQGTCSAWTDQVNSAAASQAAAAQQPLLTIGAGSRISIRGDGSNDVLRDATLDLPAPSAGTPTFIWAVVTQRTWVASKAIFSSGTTGFTTCITTPGAGASPQLVIFNGGSVPPANSGATVGTPARIEAYYSNQVSDYLKAGATTTTGTAIGAVNPPAGFNMCAVSNGTGAANCDIYAILVFSGLPSGAELSNLSSAASSLYTGVLV